MDSKVRTARSVGSGWEAAGEFKSGICPVYIRGEPAIPNLGIHSSSEYWRAHWLEYSSEQSEYLESIS